MLQFVCWIYLRQLILSNVSFARWYLPQSRLFLMSIYIQAYSSFVTVMQISFYLWICTVILVEVYKKRPPFDCTLIQWTLCQKSTLTSSIPPRHLKKLDRICCATLHSYLLLYSWWVSNHHLSGFEPDHDLPATALPLSVRAHTFIPRSSSPSNRHTIAKLTVDIPSTTNRA